MKKITHNKQIVMKNEQNIKYHEQMSQHDRTI